MKFLGLRLCDHDSNITYTDGITVKYFCLERSIQHKHYGYNRLGGWKNIFNSIGVNPDEIDAIGISLDCDRHPHVECNSEKLYEEIDIKLFKWMGFKCPVYRIDHHYAHALSVWPLSKDTTIDFVFDGWGDSNICHSIFRSDERIFKRTSDQWGSFADILGRVGNEIGLNGGLLDHAGKVMALKGYGKDYSLRKRYSFETLNELWYNFDYTQEYQDVVNFIRNAHEESERIHVEHFLNNTKSDDVISYSGGTAQNTIINTMIKRQRPNLHIPPHCNDCGLSLGIVEFLRKMFDQDPFDNSGFPFWQSDVSPNNPSEKTIKETAERLANGEIVGWYQGHGEIGPRALGNRSILMRPDIKDGKDILNSRVKHREHFRPFGASVLLDKVSDYFDWTGETPYMLYVMDVLDKQSFPSITHVDGTCRPQTVTEENNFYHQLIIEFEKLTGIPMLLNTSLNNGGRPICGSPDDALELLATSEMDMLVIGDNICYNNGVK